MSKKYHLQTKPLVVPTEDDKFIAEHWGKATSGQNDVSIAHMIAPPGWSEPAQTPEFSEYTLVMRGRKCVRIEEEDIILSAGQSIRVDKNVRVQYSNPFEEECEYVSVCTPAFDFEKVHRE